jgi:hypothetical protein
MKSREQIMHEWRESLSPEEREIARRTRQETRDYLRERQPQPIRFAYATSTPGYYAILETETKV